MSPSPTDFLLVLAVPNNVEREPRDFNTKAFKRLLSLRFIHHCKHPVVPQRPVHFNTVSSSARISCGYGVDLVRVIVALNNMEQDCGTSLGTSN